MGSTRFMVIKFKELIKTAVFAVLGVILILALIKFVTGSVSSNTPDVAYNAGTYTSQIALNDDTLDVIVTVEKSKIASIELSHSSETIPVFYPLFQSTLDSIAKDIVAKQSVEVELPTNAEITGRLLIGAVSQCLSDATK